MQLKLHFRCSTEWK